MEVLLDAVLDSIRIFPFLFGAFCIIEFLEKYSTEKRDKMLMKFYKAGPIIGSVFGCVPQCGFSVVASNLYSSGIISLGTLLAVFMSTSDEAILIMMGYPEKRKLILQLMITKVIIAISTGYVVDVLFAKKIRKKREIQVHDLCRQEGCGCKENRGIVVPALRHSIRLFGYILLFTIAINFAIEIIGVDTLQSVTLGGTIFQPFLTALIGFIPNCAASVLLTELYMKGILNFASTVAGLCTSAGVGLMVLFQVNRPMKENWKIVGILYAFSVFWGIVL